MLPADLDWHSLSVAKKRSFFEMKGSSVAMQNRRLAEQAYVPPLPQCCNIVGPLASMSHASASNTEAFLPKVDTSRNPFATLVPEDSYRVLRTSERQGPYQSHRVAILAVVIAFWFVWQLNIDVAGFNTLADNPIVDAAKVDSTSMGEHLLFGQTMEDLTPLAPPWLEDIEIIDHGWHDPVEAQVNADILGYERLAAPFDEEDEPPTLGGFAVLQGVVQAAQVQRGTSPVETGSKTTSWRITIFLFTGLVLLCVVCVYVWSLHGPFNKAETPPIATPPIVPSDLPEVDQLEVYAEPKVCAPTSLPELDIVKLLTTAPVQTQVAALEKPGLSCLSVPKFPVAPPRRKSFQYAVSYLSQPTAMRTERRALAVGCRHFASIEAQGTTHLSNNPGLLQKSAVRSSVKRRIPRKMPPERVVRARTDRQGGA